MRVQRVSMKYWRLKLVAPVLYLVLSTFDIYIYFFLTYQATKHCGLIMLKPRQTVRACQKISDQLRPSHVCSFAPAGSFSHLQLRLMKHVIDKGVQARRLFDDHATNAADAPPVRIRRMLLPKTSSTLIFSVSIVYLFIWLTTLSVFPGSVYCTYSASYLGSIVLFFLFSYSDLVSFISLVFFLLSFEPFF